MNLWQMLNNVNDLKSSFFKQQGFLYHNMASGTVNVILNVHEFVIDIGFPMQEAITNHPAHEAGGTRSHFNVVFSLKTFQV